MDISLYMICNFCIIYPHFFTYRRPTKFSSFFANSPGNFSSIFEATGSHVCSGNFEYNLSFLLYLSIYFYSGYMVW